MYEKIHINKTYKIKFKKGFYMSINGLKYYLSDVMYKCANK